MARKNKNVAQVEKKAPEAPAAEAAPKAESKPICLVPGCGREAKTRGVCPRCATAARKAIKDGKTTWADLERFGLPKPRKAAAANDDRHADLVDGLKGLGLAAVTRSPGGRSRQGIVPGWRPREANGEC